MKSLLVVSLAGLLTIIGVRLNDLIHVGGCKTYQGATFLALLHDSFPLEKAASLLKRSHCPTVGVLHRTFGLRLSRIVKLQALIKKRMKVLVFADCGPCRYPRRPKGYAPHFRPDLTIDEFNEQIITSRALRTEFRRKAIRPILAFMKRHPQIIWEISAALEDNFSIYSRKLINRAVASEIRRLGVRVRVKENPLLWAPGALPGELHTCSSGYTKTLRKGDSLSFDGHHIALGGEKGECGKDKAISTIKAAKSKGADIYLWRAPWQGLDPNSRMGPPIGERIYKVDKIKESAELFKVR